MKFVTIDELPESAWSSPTGKFSGSEKEVSEALGCDSKSTNLRTRPPFDIAMCRIPPGKTNWPYHAESAQWELYVILSGTALVRDETGVYPVAPGAAFMFKPGEAHQISNNGPADLLYFVIADNPVGDFCHYPDSKKWLFPQRGKPNVVLKGEPGSYYDGEDEPPKT